MTVNSLRPAPSRQLPASVRLAVLAPPVTVLGLVAKWPLAEYGCYTAAALLAVGAAVSWRNQHPVTDSDELLSSVADIGDIGPAQVGGSTLTALPPARRVVAAIADSRQHGE